MALNLTTNNAMIVDSLSLIEKNEVIDVKTLFFSKLDAIRGIVGLAPETLNTVARLGEAIKNDSTFYQNLVRDLSFKANTADAYRKIETYSETEVNDMMNQALSHLTKQLLLKANVSLTYSQTTIDSNIENLRADTVTKLALNNNKEQTFSQTEINDMFVQALTAQTTALANKANTADVYTKVLTYNKEHTFSQAEIKDMFVETLAAQTA